MGALSGSIVFIPLKNSIDLYDLLLHPLEIFANRPPTKLISIYYTEQFNSCPLELRFRG